MKNKISFKNFIKAYRKPDESLSELKERLDADTPYLNKNVLPTPKEWDEYCRQTPSDEKLITDLCNEMLATATGKIL